MGRRLRRLLRLRRQPRQQLDRWHLATAPPRTTHSPPQPTPSLTPFGQSSSEGAKLPRALARFTREDLVRARRRRAGDPRVARTASETVGLALLTSRATAGRSAVAVDASRPSTRAKLSSANQKSPISGDADGRRPRGRGGDSVLRRTSCPAHCGRKWPTNELLLLSRSLSQWSTNELLLPSRSLSQWPTIEVQPLLPITKNDTVTETSNEPTRPTHRPPSFYPRRPTTRA